MSEAAPTKHDLMRFLGRGRVVLVLLAAFVVLWTLIQVVNRAVYPASEEGRPYVAALELSFTEQRFTEVLFEWSGCEPLGDSNCEVPEGVRAFDDGIETFKRNLILVDYAFAVVYSMLFAGGFVWAWRHRMNERWLAVVGWAAFVMGSLDWIQNTLHLWVLRDVHLYSDLFAADLSAPLIWLASAVTLMKVPLFVAFSALISIGIGWRGWDWVRRS